MAVMKTRSVRSGRDRSTSRPGRTAAALTVLGLALAVVPAGPTLAAVISVNTTADEAGAGASCSLREAITAANTNAAFGGCPAGSPGADTINLTAGIYTLSIPNAGGANEDNNATGDLDIRESLTISGAGSGSTIIQAGTTNSNGIDKVIAANPTCADGVSVTIQSVTVRYGYNTQPISDPNFSFTGAGIDWCAGGSNETFTLSNAVVSDNTNVHGYGGGLNLDSLPGNSTATITGVTFQNNSVANDATTNTGTGAGINIFTDQSTVTISNCTFTSNQALRTNAGGGGVYHRPNLASSLSISGSTFNLNSAQGSGGAILAQPVAAGTTISITDSQFTGNTATASFGGGINLDNTAGNTTPYTLSNLLVSGNSAGTSGGGIYVGRANVTLTKSRVVNNAAPTGKGLHKNADAAVATATGNWWGCSTGPAAAPCDTATTSGGTVSYTPWQRDLLGPATTLVTNQAGTLTASFLTDSSGAAVPVANLGRIVGLGVTWAASAGSLSGQQTTVQAAGTATATFQATAVGSPVVWAKVDNDNTAPVSSNVLTVTVNKANTTTVIASDSPDPSVTGQAVPVGVLVTGAFGNSPTAPTGTVTVSSGADSCGITLPATSCNLTFTSTGAKTITAVYGGDANFNGSTSAGEAHQVDKADTTTTITSDNADPSVFGETVTVVYSVAVNAPGAGTPTGNVTVSDGVQSCVGTVAAGQCTIALTTVGARTLTATYAGDANFNGSTSAGAGHQVNQADTTTAITSDTPDPSVIAASVTVAYSVAVTSPGTGTPTGNVTVSDGVDSCTATVAAGQCSLGLTTAGARTLTATYAGDASFSGSASAGTAHQVDTVGTTTAISSDSPDPSAVGESVTVVYGVTVTPPGSGTPTGNVTVSDGVQSCTATVAAGQCSLALTTPGARTLTATYAGDSTFSGSTSAGTAHQVNTADTTTTISSDAPDPSVVGQSVTVVYAVAVTAPGSGTPTGNVTVSDGVQSCTGTVAAGQCSVVLTTPGSHTLTATYAGDAKFSGSASAGTSHQVDKAGTTTAITSDGPDPSLAGASVTVVYGVSVTAPGAGTPTGNVTVSDGVDSCTATVAAGQCSVALSTVGSRTLTATYAGDASFEGAASAGEPHAVTANASTTQITGDAPDPSVTGQGVLVSVTVTSGAGTPTGSALVDDGVGDTCTATLAGGSGSCTLTPSQAGALTLTAAYSGDSSHATSQDSTPHQVSPASTTLSLLSALPNPAPSGGSVTVLFSLTVDPPGGGSPSGTVTVDDGQGAQCSAPASAGQCTLTAGAPGARTLTATYAGDSSYDGSSGTNTLALQVSAEAIPVLSGHGLALLAGLMAVAGVLLQRRRGASANAPRRRG